VATLRFPRSRRLPRWLAGLLLVVGTGLAPPAWALCTTTCIDVNGCGSPDPGCDYVGCTRITQISIRMACCNFLQKQWLYKKFYDCNGDGVADCELRHCKPEFDITCFGWSNPTCP